MWAEAGHSGSPEGEAPPASVGIGPEWTLPELGSWSTRLHCEVRASKGKFIVHEARRTIIEMEDPMSIPSGAIPKSGDFDSAIRSLPKTTCDTMVEDPRSVFNFAGHLLLGGEVFGQGSSCVSGGWRD